MDGGSEFLNTVVIKYCTKKGLIFQQSNVESQEENGSAERAHQTVMGNVRCALVGSGMAAKWWPEALMYMTSPSGLSFRIWGSTCYAHIPKSKRANQKLSERAVECKLLGLYDNYKCYRLLDIKRNKYLIARDVRFAVTSTAGLIAKSFPSGAVEFSQETINEVCGLGKRKRDVVAQAPAKHSRKEKSPLSSMSTETVGDGGVNKGVTPIPRPRRKRTANSRPKDYVVAINTVTRSIKLIPIPRSLKEARRGPHAKQWEEALLVEYRALVKNGTWELVPLPKGRTVLGCHWAFDVKYNPDGTIDRFKARLVVRGNTQIYGIDYDEIFSPVARYESLRLFLALATIQDLYVHQMDVSTAFLNGTLFEDIYMQQPHGFRHGNASTVCKLKKSLYGLKQAPYLVCAAQ
ncbi:unnamed protein product [Phytophthora fragariaefolia]|uniref:Unnamed protein product n=1 Tax=Phytophthora fragariaefolia TaxID=1490495 RepID=A0A9W6TX74_9STRA|nr:unnamed protein product [Phytophthora fragariaefolia]